jgi:hypothetical protein
MSRNTPRAFDTDVDKNQKWQRRESKQGKQMKIHGQGLKKLASQLNKPKHK